MPRRQRRCRRQCQTATSRFFAESMLTQITSRSCGTSAKEAAELADWQPGSYTWEPQGTCEFDARLYVTLDESGAEIESTMVGDR